MNIYGDVVVGAIIVLGLLTLIPVIIALWIMALRLVRDYKKLRKTTYP
jgi:hypothetical protein